MRRGAALARELVGQPAAHARRHRGAPEAGRERRLFRQTLICHEEAIVKRSLRIDLIDGLWVAAPVQSDAGPDAVVLERGVVGLDLLADRAALAAELASSAPGGDVGASVDAALDRLGGSAWSRPNAAPRRDEPLG